MKNNTVKQKVKRIGRTEALSMIENSAGRFMTLTCDTKTKKGRVMNCQYKKTAPLGYVHVIETGGKGIKAVNMQTLSEMKINKEIYKIS